MKALITALGMLGHGTRTLSDALNVIGLPGGHEIIGQHAYGSVGDVSLNLQNNLRNSDYPIVEQPDGFAGDNKFAEAYFLWAPLKFTVGTFKQRKQMSLQKSLWDAMSRYLDGDGVFVDINGFLSDWWPVLNDLWHTHKMNWRGVHLVKDPRQWVQKCMYYKMFTSESMHYGNVHTEDTIYPPIPEDLQGMDRFEQICHYWTRMHDWFLVAGKPVFRVEDYNSPSATLQILKELYPEADGKQKDQFINAMHKGEYTGGYKRTELYEQGIWGFPHWDEWDKSYKIKLLSICGPLMEHFGYDV